MIWSWWKSSSFFHSMHMGTMKLCLSRSAQRLYGTGLARLRKKQDEYVLRFKRIKYLVRVPNEELLLAFWHIHNHHYSMTWVDNGAAVSTPKQLKRGEKTRKYRVSANSADPATQLYPQNDWARWHIRGNHDVCSESLFKLDFSSLNGLVVRILVIFLSCLQRSIPRLVERI